MSVLIKGMKMPKNCAECPVALSGKYCRINKTHTTYIKLPIRPDHCPLVELPEKHGRLIDKDRLKREMLWNFAGERIPIYDCDGNLVDFHVKDVEATINSQPIVIEAEDEG